MGLEQPSYLIQKAAPIIMRELQPYISAKVGPFLAQKFGAPLAKNVGLPLAKKIGIPLARRSGTFLLNRVGFPLINKMLFKGNMPSLLGAPAAAGKTLLSNPNTLPQTPSPEPELNEAEQTVEKKGFINLLSARGGKTKKSKQKAAKKAKTKSQSIPSGSSGLFGRRKRNSLLDYGNNMQVPSTIINPVANTVTNQVNQPSQGPIFPTEPSAPTFFNEPQESNPYFDSLNQSSLFGRKRHGFDFN